MRPRVAVALLTAALAGVAAEPARAALDLCAEAKGQPAADPENPLAAAAFQVWERVYGVFSALTGRRTDIVVLGRDAKLKSGEPFPPNAFICPMEAGQTAPVMRVTWPMIELVKNQKLYDLDFLALVLGHELGHRANEFDWAGKVVPKDRTKSVEDRADVRGAFFAAAAGYSTRRLACDDALDLFLNIEANVPPELRQGRKAALLEVLRTFDVYESLYDAAAALVFWDAGKGRHLLAWVDEHLARKMEPVPEFKVLAALGILMDTADKSCWTIKTEVPELRPTHLRCAALYPAHTAFWDTFEAGAMSDTRECGSAIDDEIDGGLEHDKTAVGLLETALAQGADELVVRTGLACSYAYLAKTKEALRELGKAEALARPGTAPSVKAALQANRTFIDWIQWMKENPAPVKDAAESDKKAWGKKLASAGGKFAAHPQLAAWIARLQGYPAVAPEAKKGPLRCQREPPKSAPGEGLALLPAFPRDARSGACPCGWSELHYVENEFGTSTTDGVRTCVPAGWGVGQRWIDIDLPREQVAATKMVVHDGLAGPVASLRTWEKSCRVLEERGIGNDGGRVLAGLCPELGAGEVILVADDCQVRRAVVLKGP